MEPYTLALRARRPMAAEPGFDVPGVPAAQGQGTRAPWRAAAGKSSNSLRAVAYVQEYVSEDADSWARRALYHLLAEEAE